MPVSIEAPDFVVMTRPTRVRIPELVSANITATLLGPNAVENDVTANIRDLLGPILIGKELIYTFDREGEYLLRILDNLSGNYWYKSFTAQSWVSSIDMKISDVAKIKVEVERMRTMVRNEVGKNG